jgi:hypothetical protein
MRARLPLLAILFLLGDLSTVAADDFDPTALIGLDLPGAVSALGLPQRMFAYRGAVESQDNVVFYYPDYRYLFWYRDRVWQVRCDRRFAGQVLGLSLGMSRDDVEKQSSTASPTSSTSPTSPTSPTASSTSSPTPSAQRQLVPSGDSLYFDLDGEKYPLRVRLVFTANVLTDLYVYRSDF